MSNQPEILLGQYQYTTLDKLSACKRGTHPSSQRFYLKERLATEIQETHQQSIMQYEEQLLAQQQRQAGALQTHLLATDPQRSVLALLDETRPHHLAYSPYGHRVADSGALSLLGFTGERPDPVTGCYLLGNGYRAFNPVLMRFNSPDGWSPFRRGGLNTYAYCLGDPVNYSDPTGHFKLGKFLANITGVRSRTMHGNISNLTSFDGDAFTFISKSKKTGTTLNISPGTARSAEEINDLVKGAGQRVSGTKATKATIANELKSTQYQHIRLIKSGSAVGGKNSLAQQLSNMTQKPVTGFRGKAEISPISSDVAKNWGKIDGTQLTLSDFRYLPEYEKYAIKNLKPKIFTPKKNAHAVRTS